MKLLIKLVVIILVILIALLAAGDYLAGSALKDTLAKVGADATGTSVDVGSLDLQLLRGRIALEDVRVGNPPGYKTQDALRISRITVELDSGSLLSDTIQVQSVDIADAVVTYEVKGPRRNNIRTIQDNIQAYTAKSGRESSGKGRGVRIGTLQIYDGKVRAAATLLGGGGVTLPMPNVELTDITTGKEDSAGSAAGVPVIVGRVLRAILGASGQAAKGLGQGLGGVGAAATEAAGGVLHGLEKLVPKGSGGERKSP